MPVPTVPGLAAAARLLAVPGVLVVTLLLYAWPLVDGADPAASAAHLGLQLLAGTAAGAACLHAAAAAAGRVRLAWSLLATGCTALACAQAVTADPGLGALARGTLGGAGPVSTAQAAVAVAGTGALLVLPLTLVSTGVRARVLDAALAATGVSLLVWTVGSGLSSTPLDIGATVRLGAASALLGLCVLVLTSPRRRPRAMATLALGLGLLALAVGAVVVARWSALPELAGPAGAASFAGLLLVALAAVPAEHAAGPGASLVAEESGPDPSRGRGLVLGLSMLAVAGVGTLAAASLSGMAAAPVPVVLLAGVIVLSWLRLALLVSDGRDRLLRLAEDERQMRHQAFHDQLTGVANRQLFHDRLEHALAVHGRSRRSVALLFGDLDGFKDVNDRYGHEAGDRVLRTVAQRMSAVLRPTDTLARLGGDEFAVLLEEGEQPEVVVQRLFGCFDEGIGLPEGAARVRMSIGTAVVAADDPTPTVDELLGRADVAMYAAKRRLRPERGVPPGLPTPTVQHDDDDGRQALRAALVRDLAADRLEVVYQPLVDPDSGEVAGVEALARWRFAGLDVPPEAFVALAEQAGLGGVLTDLVLERAAAQVRRWSTALGHDRLTLAVNLTAGELMDPSLPERVGRLVARHGLHPGQLVLETTSASLGDGVAARRLVDGGAVLSLVSTVEAPVALGSLHGLPISSMKVAGRPLGGDDGAAETRVRVLRAIGRELDLRVVVERVESREQLAVVRRLGGLLAQGYLLAPPAPAAELDPVVLHGCRVPA